MHYLITGQTCQLMRGITALREEQRIQMNHRPLLMDISATVEAIALVGACPVIVDIDPETLVAAKEST
jgi:hypothetical protein